MQTELFADTRPELSEAEENYVEVLPDLLRLADEIEEMQKSKAA